MTLKQFIKEHREELDQYIARALVRSENPRANDEERRWWILNDERLYRWARAGGGEDMTHTTKHTPGPWHVGLKPGPMVYGPQGEQIVGLNVMLDSDEVLANAKFIAAAPAMYEALKAIVGQQTPNRWGYDAAEIALSDEWRAQARAALAQAEGTNHDPH